MHTYGYDDRGRLIDVDAGTATYTYNGQGQRVSKTSGTTTLFAYGEVGELLGEYDASGSAIQETVWFNGAPVALLDGTSTYYVHSDHLGTPRVISDGNTAIWRWESDPFGSTLPDEDPDNDGITLTYNLRFPGQYYDAETGLHYNYYRSYDPSTGRYLESDPIGLAAGLNTYAYVGNMPTMLVDPFGLVEVPPGYPAANPGYLPDYYETTGRQRPPPGPGIEYSTEIAGCGSFLCGTRSSRDSQWRRELMSFWEFGGALSFCMAPKEMPSKCEDEGDSEDDLRGRNWSLGLGRYFGLSSSGLGEDLCFNVGLGVGPPINSGDDLGPIE